MWFKVNLTLYKTHISRIWDNDELVWKYLQTVISWDDVVKVALLFKYWNGNPFSEKKSQQIKKNKKKTRKRYGFVKTDLCTTPLAWADISIIDCAVCIGRYVDTTVQFYNTSSKAPQTFTLVLLSNVDFCVPIAR